ncbi:UNVERIFIED_CONTAM: hypothetical protein Sindi_3068200 [Sesamum indicum]
MSALEAADDVSPRSSDDVSPSCSDDVSPSSSDDVSPNISDDVSPSSSDDVSPTRADVSILFQASLHVTHLPRHISADIVHRGVHVSNIASRHSSSDFQRSPGESWFSLLLCKAAGEGKGRFAMLLCKAARRR